MAGRGPQSFQKKLKEQQRKEKQQEKLAKKLERRRQAQSSPGTEQPLGEAEPSELESDRAGESERTGADRAQMETERA